MSFKFNKKWLGAAVGAVLAVGLGVCLHAFTFGSGLVNLSYDLLLVARGETPADEAVVVYLDEASHRELGQPLNAPWDRAIHAQLIDRLTNAGAKVIVFDVVFSDPNLTKPEADQRLADAMKNSGRVVLAADNVPTGEGKFEAIPPIDLLRDSAVDMGSAEVDPSRDLIVRKHTLNRQLPSLSWSVAQFLKAKVTQQPGQESVERWLNYYGPANSRLAISYAEALRSDLVPESFFRDKAVFIGARIKTKFAGERKDEYRTPFSFWSSQDEENIYIPGVEIQATAFLNLLRGDWLMRPSFRAERIAIVLLGLLFGCGLVQFRPWMATGIAFAGLLAVALISYLLFIHKLTWWPWLIVVIQIAIALIWSIVFNSIQLYVQNKLYEASLEMYLSPKLVKKFATNRDLLKPGAKKETLTILFSDIAGFTSISEGMDSDELAKHMNSYFETAVAQCIHHTDGTIVKYIGDAIFAFWNAPDPQSDHALRACEAALRFRDQPPQYMNQQQLITRIGLHTGVANVGNFGSTARVDYTALGENINLAARMEGLNKYLGTILLATGETMSIVGDNMVSRFAGRFRLKGFERAVQVHELLGRKQQAEGSWPWREAFAEALKHFEQGNFEAAEAGFRNTLELRADDGPSKFYLKHIAEVRHHSRLEDWTGEVELKEK